MAELDFSKIFGETATSKASFTDENYLRGWGYLGSTPPPYQLFDCLQSINDKKSKYLYDRVNENDNKLSTHNTNATAHADIRAKITSDINSHNINTESHADIRQKFNLYLSKAESETKLYTHNTATDSHQPILNAIKAISGMSEYDIAPSKTIAAIIPLLGFGGIVAQRLEPNGYVKFANGLTIQWGQTINSQETFASKATFPINFSKIFSATGALSQFNGSSSTVAQNIDDLVQLTLVDISFNFYAHYYIAIGLS